MNPFKLIIKYYLYTIFIGAFIGFYQYASKGNLSILVNIALHIFILWGLIYSHLKEADLNYKQSEFLIIYIGTGLLPLVALFFVPTKLGMPSINIIYAAIGAAASYAILVALFYASKQIIISAPVDDEYDS